MTGLVVDEVVVSGRDRPRLDGVSATFDPGTLTVVLGPNGAGKSSLARVLVGLLRPDQGRVRVDGADVHAMPRLSRSALLGWLPQHPRPEDGVTARELVEAARYRHAESRVVARDAAMRALASVGADAWAERLMSTLSGGEAQRVRVAALVAQEAAWWVLDEPVNHLDPAVRLALGAIVRARVDAGGGVVWVTHDLDLIGQSEDASVLVMAEGRVVRRCAVDDDALGTVLSDVFGVPVARVDVLGRARWLVGGP